MLQRTIDQSEETLEQKEQELVFLHRHQQNKIREQQISEGLIVPSEVEALDLSTLKVGLEESLAISRDLDLLKIAENLTELCLFKKEIASVCLFNIFRGNFSAD